MLKRISDLKNPDFVEDLVGDSMMIDAEAQVDNPEQMPTYLIDPVNEVENYFKEGVQEVIKMAGKTATIIDGSLMNGRCGRVSWNHG